MKTLHHTHIIALIVALATALYLGWVLTETKYRIAAKYPLFNRKPFRCRPCLTFHFGWMLSGAVALSAKQVSYFIVGTATSLFV